MSTEGPMPSKWAQERAERLWREIASVYVGRKAEEDAIAAALDEARNSTLSRLRNPDEAVTTAVGKAICNMRWSALTDEEQSLWRSKAWPICRALADVLAATPPEATEE